MKNDFAKFTISQAAILIKDNKCLIGEFISNPGFWGLPGGRIDKNEDNITAFKRELKEEINLDNFKIVELVDFNTWYGTNNIPRSSVMFLIDANTESIKIGDEFIRLKWISEEELDKYNFVWKHTNPAIKKGFKLFREKMLK